MKCIDCEEKEALFASDYCQECANIICNDADREMLGDDADYFEAAGYGSFGNK